MKIAPVTKTITRCVPVAGCILLALTMGRQTRADVNVTQFHNHLSRDGLYIDPAFTPSNAAALTRDTAFNGAVVGNVYAQPLYIEGGPRGRAVIIVATESNNVYALDAISGNVDWETNVAPSVAPSALPCGNLTQYGITGTPVVDLPSRSLFFDALTEGPISGTVEHLIYSLNVDTGALNPGWPVNVNNTANYNGIAFSSTAQGERGALAVIGSNVYVPYGGLYGDCGNYHGWVVGVPINNPSNVMAWATTALGGGIWAVGGVASDGVDPFVVTGNTFGASTWEGGEAVLHLLPNLTLPAGDANYWAPTNWLYLDQEDQDLGGSGAVLIHVPGATPSNVVAALGKEGYVYLVNQTNLGGITTPLAKLSPQEGHIITGPATYRTSVGTYLAFSIGSDLITFLIQPSSPPTLTNAWLRYYGGPGSPFITSTDGTNNMIVWGIGAENTQQLYAYDGDSGAVIFDGGGSNDTLANTHRFSTAIVARGRIYVGTDNLIYAFNTPPPTVTSVHLSNAVILPTGAFQFTFTNVPGALFNVFANTNLTDSFTNWTWLGEPEELAPGQYQFTDISNTNGPERFYTVVSP